MHTDAYGSCRWRGRFVPALMQKGQDDNDRDKDRKA